MPDLHLSLSDDLWQEMLPLEGETILAIVLWDRSLADEGMAQPVSDQNRVFVDLDLYLQNQTKLELYGVAVSQDETSPPLAGMERIGQTLTQFVQANARLDEIAAGEDDMLALILRAGQNRSLLLAVSAWQEDVWETLPTTT